jgi:hypothetical protein
MLLKHTSLEISAVPNRICLPYSLDLFELYRWINYSDEIDQSNLFFVSIGNENISWQGSDIIQLWNFISENCIGYNLSSSYIGCYQNNDVMYLDADERFRFFCANQEKMNCLYPFPEEICWEHFSMISDEAENGAKRKIFDLVHTLGRGD